MLPPIHPNWKIDHEVTLMLDFCCHAENRLLAVEAAGQKKKSKTWCVNRTQVAYNDSNREL